VNNSRGKGIEWEVWCGSVGGGATGRGTNAADLSRLYDISQAGAASRVESSRRSGVASFLPCPHQMDGWTNRPTVDGRR
jgi:hypothetical protein